MHNISDHEPWLECVHACSSQLAVLRDGQWQRPCPWTTTAGLAGAPPHLPRPSMHHHPSQDDECRHLAHRAHLAHLAHDGARRGLRCVSMQFGGHQDQCWRWCGAAPLALGKALWVNSMFRTLEHVAVEVGVRMFVFTTFVRCYAVRGSWSRCARVCLVGTSGG